MEELAQLAGFVAIIFIIPCAALATLLGIGFRQLWPMWSSRRLAIVGSSFVPVLSTASLILYLQTMEVGPTGSGAFLGGVLFGSIWLFCVLLVWPVAYYTSRSVVRYLNARRSARAEH